MAVTGDGGIITINASEVYIENNSEITTSSHYTSNSASDHNGGDGGSITINAILVNISGILRSQGGSGENDECGSVWAGGHNGNGGTIIINATTIEVNIMVIIKVLNLRGPLFNAGGIAISHILITGIFFISSILLTSYSRLSVR